jgi:hypothetical protein
MKIIPENWVVVKIKDKSETYYKVFGSWRGGYLDGNSWRLNSGIKSVYLEDDNWRISGYSGSHYICNKNTWGFATNYSREVLNNMIVTAEKHGVSMEILEDGYDYLTINV